MTDEQAVQLLYQAASMAKLSAKEHEALANAAKQLLDTVKEDEPKEDTKKAK